MKLRKGAVIFLALATTVSQTFVPLAQAQEQNLIEPQVATDNAPAVTNDAPSPTPAKVTVAKNRPIPFASMLSLGAIDRSIASAHTRLPISIQKLSRKDFKADEEIPITVNNPDEENLTTKIVDVEGRAATMLLAKTTEDATTEIRITPSNQFKPGKYTLNVTDQNGQTSSQDFTWGVLALNPDKAVYKPDETATFGMGVLDDKGEMVCDASVEMKVLNTATRNFDTLSTQDGTIKVNPECRSKGFSLNPDYESSLKLVETGTYEITLTAKTKNGPRTIYDQVSVKETTPFEIKRTSATRIYPPSAYPMKMEITAEKDFSGSITETVPDTFEITPAEEVETYDSMKTVYTNENKDPEQKVLGAQSLHLRMPFDGNPYISQGFGVGLTDLGLRQFYSNYGLAGHDGIDFGMPIGTPLYAVDDGNVMFAQDGDYGTTIIIQHSWGKSYYGHLSKLSVNAPSTVKQGSLIGYSGNSGESTGPHLHFGMKPQSPDLANGYAGKIDPMAYLPIAQNSSTASDLISAIGVPSVLAAASESAVASSSAADAVFKVAGDQMVQAAADEENPPTEKVKIITWNVELKKGEKTSLSYYYKAPPVSPQFYTIGPLHFYAKNDASSVSPTDKINEVFVEQRKWQIAADAIGTDWYNFNWPYRKEITIDHTKVPNSTQTNFPVLVSLTTDTALAAKAQSTGDDIVFTDSTGTVKIPHEIESYTTATGKLVAWVKVSSLSTSTDTDIYMYYGNPSASNQEDPTNVWDSNYRAVYHMKENPAVVNCVTNKEVCDSTTSANNGDMTGSMTSGAQVTGQINGSIDFDGVDDLITVPHNANLNFGGTASYTISFWVNSPGATGSYNGILSKDSSTRAGWEIYRQDTGGNFITMERRNASGVFLESCDNSFTANTWTYMTFYYNGSNVICYKNGALSTSRANSGSMGAPTDDLEFAHSNQDGNWNGILDEVHISGVARSADWTVTEYNNQSSPSTFYTLGAEETKAYAASPNSLMKHGQYFNSSGTRQPFVF